jgi:chromosome segregation ATPase
VKPPNEPKRPGKVRRFFAAVEPHKKFIDRVFLTILFFMVGYMGLFIYDLTAGYVPRIRNRLDATNTELGRLRETLESAERDLARFRSEQLAALRRTTESANAQVGQITPSAAELEKRLREDEKKWEETAQSLAQLGDSVIKLRASVDVSNTQIAAAGKEIEKLVQATQAAQAQAGKSQAELLQLTQAANKLSASLADGDARVGKDLAGISQTAAQLQSALRELQRKASTSPQMSREEK